MMTNTAQLIHRHRAKEYCLNLSIKDPSLKDTMTLMIFRQSPELIPKVEPGDFISATAMTQQFGGRLQALSKKGVQFEVKRLDPSDSTSPYSQVTQILEKWKASMLSSSSTDSSKSALFQFSKPAATSKRPLKSIAEIGAHEYFDLNAILIRVLPYSPTDICTVIEVADYTSNKSLKPVKLDTIPGLPVKDDMIFRITLWDEHRDKVIGLPVGVIISFKNVRSKLSGDGYIEGVMHGERNFKDSSNSLVVMDQSHPMALEVKKRSQKLRILDMPPTSITDPSLRITSLKDVVACNEHVKKRIKVRVLDYMPRNLEDFCRPSSNEQGDRFEPQELLKTCNCGLDLKSSYEFVFALLVTDGTEAIPISFSGIEATDFLGDIVPCNLHEHQDMLAKLKNRLSRLFAFNESIPSGNEEGRARVEDAQEFEVLIQSFHESFDDVALSGVDDSEEPQWSYKIFNTVLNYID